MILRRWRKMMTIPKMTLMMKMTWKGIAIQMLKTPKKNPRARMMKVMKR